MASWSKDCQPLHGWYSTLDLDLSTSAEKEVGSGKDDINLNAMSVEGTGDGCNMATSADVGSTWTSRRADWICIDAHVTGIQDAFLRLSKVAFYCLVK